MSLNAFMVASEQWIFVDVYKRFHY